MKIFLYYNLDDSLGVLFRRKKMLFHINNILLQKKITNFRHSTLTSNLEMVIMEPFI